MNHPYLPAPQRYAAYATKEAHMLDDLMLSRGLCANSKSTNDFAYNATSLAQVQSGNEALGWVVFPRASELLQRAAPAVLTTAARDEQKVASGEIRGMHEGI